MSRKVADPLWEMLANAGVKRCYGIVGGALNPVSDGLRRSRKIELVHVRHEEYGVFAAVAEAHLTGDPVAVCGTAGPGVTHPVDGLIDARKEGAAVIAIAGFSPRCWLDAPWGDTPCSPCRRSCGSPSCYFRFPSGPRSTSALSPSRTSGRPVASTATPGRVLPRRERIFSSTSFSAFSNSSRFAILVDRLPMAPSCHNKPACVRDSSPT